MLCSRRQVLSIGTLVGFDWKLGVAVASSQCANLNVPFVSVVVRVADINGNVISHPFEMNFTEFYVSSSLCALAMTANQNFHKSFTEIDNLLTEIS